MVERFISCQLDAIDLSSPWISENCRTRVLPDSSTYSAVKLVLFFSFLFSGRKVHPDPPSLHLLFTAEDSTHYRYPPYYNLRLAFWTDARSHFLFDCGSESFLNEFFFSPLPSLLFQRLFIVHLGSGGDLFISLFWSWATAWHIHSIASIFATLETAPADSLITISRNQTVELVDKWSELISARTVENKKTNQRETSWRLEQEPNLEGHEIDSHLCQNNQKKKKERQQGETAVWLAVGLRVCSLRGRVSSSVHIAIRQYSADSRANIATRLICILRTGSLIHHEQSSTVQWTCRSARSEVSLAFFHQVPHTIDLLLFTLFFFLLSSLPWSFPVSLFSGRLLSSTL